MNNRFKIRRSITVKNVIRAFMKILIPSKFRPGLETMCKKVYFFGFKYRCPFCNSRLRRFLPYGLNFPVLKDKKVIGGGYRQNSLCPVCGSFDRERLLYLYISLKTVIFEKPQKLLHIAPEERMRDILGVRTNLDYLTADLFSDRVMVKMDVTNIEFPDASFDAIICNHVLEHVIDDRKAMGELHRVLRPGGWAILQVPISLSLNETYEDFSITTPQGREEAFGQDDHVRIYAKDYKARLRQAGFEVDIFNWNMEAKKFGGPKNAFGLNKDECMYVVQRRQRSAIEQAASLQP